MNASVLKGPAGYAVAILAGGLVIWLLWGKLSGTAKAAASAAGGVLSGNNDLTTNQTDASGDKVTAYQGAGVLGTAGAAANTISGGTLSSLGETLGGWAYDLLHSDTTPGS